MKLLPVLGKTGELVLRAWTEEGKEGSSLELTTLRTNGKG